MHPWLAVVAIRIMAIKKRTTNARWARSLGKRILNIYSGAVLWGRIVGGSHPIIPETLWQYISTRRGQYSTQSGGKNRVVITRHPPACMIVWPGVSLPLRL